MQQVDRDSSTFSGYMIAMIQDCHSGMDSHQAILPDALRVNANPFQTYLCRSRRPRKRIHAPWMDLSLPSMALDTRFPASMTILCIICKVEFAYMHDKFAWSKIAFTRRVHGRDSHA